MIHLTAQLLQLLGQEVHVDETCIPLAEPQQYDADIQEKEVLSLRCSLYDERDVRLCTRTASSVQLS